MKKKIRVTYDNLAPNLLIDGMLPPDEPPPRPPGPPLEVSLYKKRQAQLLQQYQQQQYQRSNPGRGGQSEPQLSQSNFMKRSGLGLLDSTNVISRVPAPKRFLENRRKQQNDDNNNNQGGNRPAGRFNRGPGVPGRFPGRRFGAPIINRRNGVGMVPPRGGAAAPGRFGPGRLPRPGRVVPGRVSTPPRRPLGGLPPPPVPESTPLNDEGEVPPGPIRNGQRVPFRPPPRAPIRRRPGLPVPHKRPGSFQGRSLSRHKVVPSAENSSSIDSLVKAKTRELE